MSSLTLLQSIHENLATAAKVKSVFGEPITAGEKTIIPVARIVYGFGGGTGSGGLETKTARGEGGGGGGGVRALPVGVFEVSPKETRFVAIGDRKKSLGTLLLGAGLGLLFARRKRFGRCWSAGDLCSVRFSFKTELIAFQPEAPYVIADRSVRHL